MTPVVTPSFAAWQESRGITPWTEVQAWALVTAAFVPALAVAMEVFEALCEALAPLMDALDPLVDALTEWGLIE